MKKVLIFYASYGGGHLSAAKSIKQHLEDFYPDVQVEMIDCIKYINKALDALTTTAYREMAKKAPWAWEKVYYKSQSGLLAKVSTTSNKIMAVKMAKLFREFQPDIVISTHPFGSQMTSYLKQKGKTNCKLATIMTDFAPHDQWLIGHLFVDFYFVSNSSMKDLMIKETPLLANKVFVTGIPISHRFSQVYSKEEICASFDLLPNLKTILFFGGGEYGLGKDKTVAILDSLADFSSLQVVAIAGKNTKMKLAFEQIVTEKKREKTIKVLSFTDKVPELMAISDLVITKPGGLTVSESLACHLPLIVINPIPGQEEENASFLENSNCAIWLKKKDDPKQVLSTILQDSSKLEKMKESSSKLAKPNSTRDICQIIFSNKTNI